MSINSIDRMMESSLESNRLQALSFIKNLEAENPQFSPYAIANELRRYTRKSYTNNLFRWATLSNVEFIDNRLDFSLILCQQTTDFAHFIASLSDQIQLPSWGSWFNFTTDWTAKHSSWSGDLSQAILDFREGKFHLMEDALEADASLPDMAANITAFRVGFIVNQNTYPGILGWRKPEYGLTISEAILACDRGFYSGHVREFIIHELTGKIVQDKLINSEEVEARIRRSIVEFLGFMRLRKLGIKIKTWTRVRQTYKQLSKATHHRVTAEEEGRQDDVQMATAYFLNYLLQFGKLSR